MIPLGFHAEGGGAECDGGTFELQQGGLGDVWLEPSSFENQLEPSPYWMESRSRM